MAPSPHGDAQRLRAELAAGRRRRTPPAGLAPPVEDFAEHLVLLSRNAIPWSLIGFPAVSVPCGRPGSLPVGLQLVARPWREDLLVAVGVALETALRS